jgi:hypothetical protein
MAQSRKECTITTGNLLKRESGRIRHGCRNYNNACIKKLIPTYWLTTSKDISKIKKRRLHLPSPDDIWDIIKSLLKWPIKTKW